MHGLNDQLWADEGSASD